ncbi:voltage-gated hydrogen channel 1-like [Orbicella faveolata]|uniref:voltage-gated hydrogen channel 1-like n=1 Tax=Orbicella faveolata TaxID=48498 RepID=UPI0009E19847|nr:voltage-gated hydrogen channel 1-like [Orbicella faveolata]
MDESAELTKSDKEDGRKTYMEIWRRRLTETYEAQGSCKECCRVLRHSLAVMLTGVTWQLGIVILVLIEVLINLVLMLIEFHVIKDESHLSRHLLHFVGLSILGVFVLEVFLKFYAMGCEYYLEEKMEIFDGFVVVSAFVIEVVLSVIRAKKAWNGLAFIIVLRLWRIFRVVINIVAFKEEFYELIDDVDAPPKQEHMETEATDSEKSEEKQKQAGNN